MLVLNKFIYFFARWAILLSGFVFLVAALLVIFHLAFGSRADIRLGDRTLMEMTDWKEGYPVSANALSSKFPASANVDGNGAKAGFTTTDPAVVKVNSIRIGEFIASVEPTTWKQKLFFLLPPILNFLLFSWAAWQLARLIHLISKGNAYRRYDYKNFSYLGYAILLVQGIFILLGFLHPESPVQVISASEGNSADIFPFKFYFSGPFSYTWTLVALVLLIISKAWKQGMSMQEESDGTF